MSKSRRRRKNRAARFFLRALIIIILLYLAVEKTPLKEWVQSYVSPYISLEDDSVLAPLISDEVLEEAPQVSDGRYAYETLSDEEKAVYNEVYDAILYMKSDVRISTTDKDVLKKAYSCVMADYGGLFWVSGYTYNTYTLGSEIQKLTVTPNYSMTEEERDQYQALVDAQITEWLSGISADASDYEKTKYVFENLIERVDYNLEAENNQNILSVFLGGETVCQGYSDAANVLLEKLGIQATIVTGTGNGESHAWNLVYLDGAYYYFDATWGNSRYIDQDQSENYHVNYTYLNATDDTIFIDHTLDTTYFPVPVCDSLEDSYFVQEGLYFTDYIQSDVGNRIKERFMQGEQMVSVRFSNPVSYQQALQDLIYDGEIRNYLYRDRISYITQDETFIFSIKF